MLPAENHKVTKKQIQKKDGTVILLHSTDLQQPYYCAYLNSSLPKK